MLKQLTLLTGIFAFSPALAHAYIGPGMGLGVVASILGLVAVFFMVLVALVWFPLKRKLRQRREARANRLPDAS